MELTVLREGKDPLPLTQVPRLEKNDVLQVRLLEEQVSGMKPDQSNWDWTFLVAFVNPGRNNEKQRVVSEEIQFRKTGWYKEYSFAVPYDSQPIIFLYTKPNYRNKILNLITKNQEEIRKIGEKTIELSDAYAKIDSFLNELQSVINRYQYGVYGNNRTYSSYGTYGNYGGYGNYNPYGTAASTSLSSPFMEQTIERLARSFNIQLPNCWQNASAYGVYGNYGANNNNNTYGTYNNGYNNGYNPYGNYNNGLGNDFIGRAQCVAKSIRVEDFDLSVSRLLQQGGILTAAQLTQKYPQIAFWINVAAAALDFIIKITRKTPLRIVPTILSTTETQAQNFGYQQNYSVPTQNLGYQANSYVSNLPGAFPAVPRTSRVSLYAEAPPSENNFVTAYPLVLQKWQASPDPEVLSLPIPNLSEPCLHPGLNMLKNTDVLNDWMSDGFTKDFKLIISSPNGFRREFPIKKNVGLNGWDLNLTKEEIASFPKVSMTLESVITGKRGFNEIKSPKFDLPLPTSSTWEVDAESQKIFAVGGKRTVVLKNQMGSCRCLQTVIYKPSFGGQFVFDANDQRNNLRFSDDGREVSFEVDTTNFLPGPGQLELKQYGGEFSVINVNLYPPPPNIFNIKISKGDSRALIIGERLEQLRAVRINGKRAVIEGGVVNSNIATGNQSGYSVYQGNNTASPSGNQNSSYSNNINQSTLSEATFVFEDPNLRQTVNNIQLELELEGNRFYRHPKTFEVALARPAIAANEAKEIEGIAIAAKTNPFLAYGNLPLFSINTTQISASLQNVLTDYDFKVENIQIETRIENSQVNPAELPKVSFEVLDWKNIQLTFLLDEQVQKFLGGRRLQFRIRDRQRGESDWYTLRNTFVRIPEIKSVRCPPAMKENCEVKGLGIEYISQVSVDGGKTWYPQEPATLIVQTTPDGQKVALIPRFSSGKSLRIRLRDFRINDGLMVDARGLSSVPGR